MNHNYAEELETDILERGYINQRPKKWSSNNSWVKIGSFAHKLFKLQPEKVVLVNSYDSAPPPLPAGFEISIFKVGLVQLSSYLVKVVIVKSCDGATPALQMVKVDLSYAHYYFHT